MSSGIQSFHEDQEEARAGENVGVLLRGVKREEEVERGRVLTVPGGRLTRPHE